MRDTEAEIQDVPRNTGRLASLVNIDLKKVVSNEFYYLMSPSLATSTITTTSLH